MRQSLEFGTYLPRESISAELAQTCEELRRFLEERGTAQETVTSASWCTARYAVVRVEQLPCIACLRSRDDTLARTHGLHLH